MELCASLKHWPTVVGDIGGRALEFLARIGCQVLKILIGFGCQALIDELMGASLSLIC